MYLGVLMILFIFDFYTRLYFFRELLGSQQNWVEIAVFPYTLCFSDTAYPTINIP